MCNLLNLLNFLEVKIMDLNSTKIILGNYRAIYMELLFKCIT